MALQKSVLFHIYVEFKQTVAGPYGSGCKISLIIHSVGPFFSLSNKNENLICWSLRRKQK